MTIRHRARKFPGSIGKPSRDTGRVFGADLTYDTARAPGPLASLARGHLGSVLLFEMVTAAVLSLVAGWSWQDALEAFVVTNSMMGVAFAGCGGILAWHRQRNPIGWLFVAGWPGSRDDGGCRARGLAAASNRAPL